jgi:hypothetical protein
LSIDPCSRREVRTWSRTWRRRRPGQGDGEAYFFPFCTEAAAVTYIAWWV